MSCTHHALSNRPELENRGEKKSHFRLCETGVQVYSVISLRHSVKIALMHDRFKNESEKKKKTCPHVLLQKWLIK